jgi:hypothetical protein
LLKTIRTADRDRNLTDPQLLRIRKRQEGKLRGVNANYGQIGVGIIANQCCSKRSGIVQSDLDRLGAMNDVTISQDEAVRGDQETAAAAFASLA